MRIDAADPTTWTDADRVVAAWVIDQLREWRGYLDDHPSLSWQHTPEQRQQSDHMRQCATLRVTGFEGYDGLYGCDTGCEYIRLDGRVACDHYPAGAEFEVGEFGELKYWLQDL
jgi:hypothetical protein